MTKYTLKMRDDQCDKTREIDAESIDEAIDIADAETTEWIEGGEWGNEGASVTAWWTLIDDEGDEVVEGSVTVEIAPDHTALIRAAGGDVRCDHEWTSEGEGGCDENPGAWSTGGTSMLFRSHCSRCGLVRIEHMTGSQKNPGEHDTVEYRLPDEE